MGGLQSDWRDDTAGDSAPGQFLLLLLLLVLRVADAPDGAAPS
jgi:hypothetical protein